MLPPKTVDSYGPALSCVRDALLDRIRYLRETDGDEQMAKTFANELSKWGMECEYLYVYQRSVNPGPRAIFGSRRIFEWPAWPCQKLAQIS